MALQPNIIVILIDDLGARDLGFCGSTFYETPHLDRLAAEGVRFTDAYASCPVCSPSRASLLTGKYPARVGITQFIGGHTVGHLCDVPYFQQLPHSERTVAARLREAGYATWHVGKWHLGRAAHWPQHHGFDVNIGGCDWGMPQHGFFSPYHLPTLEDGPPGEYLTDRLTTEAVSLINSRPADQPYFLNLWHYAVHVPIQAPEALIEKYRKKAAQLGLDPAGGMVEGANFPCHHKRHQKIARRVIQSSPEYAAMVENLDTNIGALMEAVRNDSSGRPTLVFFTSDNGGLATAEGSPTSNLPLAEGKGWMQEGGIRVPLLAWGPELVLPGKECTVPVTTPDIYSTMLAAAGVPDRAEEMDGKSFLPALQGDPEFNRGPIFWHYPHYSNQGGTPGSSVRDGDWKLIEHFEDGHLELYNLRTDLGETCDLSTEQPALTQSLHEKLRAWRESVQALIPKPNPHWNSP